MAEKRMAPSVVDLCRSEIDILEIFERLFEPSRHEKVSVFRKIPNEKFERSDAVEAGLQIARGHCQFIEICQEA